MNYLSRFIILIVILLVSWSASASTKLIFSPNTKLTYFIPMPVTRTAIQVKDNLIDSVVKAVIKDFNN